VTFATQQRLFPQPIDESKLGPNQQEVLARIDRFGGIGVRAAGRIVFANRGANPDRVPKEWLSREGWRVLISLKDRGLLTYDRRGVWTRRKRCSCGSNRRFEECCAP
jgi:hypothetical protein